MEHWKISAKKKQFLLRIPDAAPADPGLHIKSDFVQIATDEVSVFSSNPYTFYWIRFRHLSLWWLRSTFTLSVFGPPKDDLYKVLMVPSTGFLFHWIKLAGVNGWNRPTHHDMLSTIISIPLKRRLLPLTNTLILKKNCNV